jgi:hypothetical protein
MKVKLAGFLASSLGAWYGIFLVALSASFLLSRAT